VIVRKASIVAAGLAAGLGLGACGNRARDKEPPPRDAQRARRVIEPSTDPVGPLPPYAIRGDGVGPYKLGEKLSDLLEQLASGPRIELFEIAGVVHRNVIRAEDDTVLIGGEQASTASFVAVVGGAGVASTESGIHVGSTRDEVLRALGPPIDEPARARDPRLIVPAGLPGVRVIVDGARVAAMVVTGATASPRQAADCARPASTEMGFGTCMTAAGELVVVQGDDVVIKTADGERVVATPPRQPGLVFAARLHVAADGRDELVMITRTDEATSRSWGITAYRLEGARLVRTVDATQLYQLSSANARWIGADLREVELYLELTSRADGIEIGGLLTTRSGGSDAKAGTKFRDVVVISSASVARRRGKSASAEASDAGVAGPAPAPRAATDAAPDAREPASEPAEPDKP
jgi:hypothetical protein